MTSGNLTHTFANGTPSPSGAEDPQQADHVLGVPPLMFLPQSAYSPPQGPVLRTGSQVEQLRDPGSFHQQGKPWQSFMRGGLNWFLENRTCECQVTSPTSCFSPFRKADWAAEERDPGSTTEGTRLEPGRGLLCPRWQLWEEGRRQGLRAAW